MTDCDRDRNTYPSIVNLTVTDGIILLGQTNLLDLVDAGVGFCMTQELRLVFSAV